MGFFRKTTGFQHNRPDTSPFVSSHNTPTASLSSPRTWRRSFRVTGVTFLIMATAGAVVIADSQVTSQWGAPKPSPAKSTSSHSVQLQIAPVTTTTRPNTSVAHSTPSTTVHAMTSTTGSNPASTQLTVNGQNVPVPQNGSVDRTFTSDNGTTSVNVSASSDNTGSNTSSTSFSMNVTTSDSTGGSTNVQMNNQGGTY